MIKFENTEVVGFEPAIRGMRNPHNSWDKSDSIYDPDIQCQMAQSPVILGPNDLKLMESLVQAGTDHRKFMRMIVVYVDITAPLYWWKEFDTYKVGTVANSCSTMHSIAEKEFTLDDFSHEHLIPPSIHLLKMQISALNELRDWYNKYTYMNDQDKKHFAKGIGSKKDLWWQMIQLLPSSYNQRRTVMMSYETLANIYKSRKNHKQDEWRVDFMNWIEFCLPYSELIKQDWEDREKAIISEKFTIQ